MKETKQTSSRKISYTFFSILLLIFCTCYTAIALMYEKAEIKDNFFETGSISINLNDGKAVINEDELLLEPGMTIKRNFFIENTGSSPAYYKLYFEDIEGLLANVLEVEIKEGKTILFSGRLPELTQKNVKAADDILNANEKKDLTLIIKVPKNTPSKYQNTKLTFRLSADAVQTKNNNDKNFK